MAKRFTDTEKWKKPWFRNLTPEFKCLWAYILDNCDHAGIWDVDFKLAGFMIGTDINAEHAINMFTKQIKILNGGNKWFIEDFIEYQYGELNPENRVHASAIRLLQKEGAYKGHNKTLIGIKDKDTDKDKDKDKKYNMYFMQFWQIYPIKKGKAEAYKAWKKQKLNGDSQVIIEKVGKFMAQDKKWKAGYIPHASTFLNQQRWEDEIEEDNEKLTNDKLKEIFRSK